MTCMIKNNTKRSEKTSKYSREIEPDSLPFAQNMGQIRSDNNIAILLTKRQDISPLLINTLLETDHIIPRIARASHPRNLHAFVNFGDLFVVVHAQGDAAALPACGGLEAGGVAGEIGAEVRLYAGVGLAPAVMLRRELVERDLDVGVEDEGQFSEIYFYGVPKLGRDESFERGEYEHQTSDLRK